MKKSGAFFVCLLLTLLCCAPIARAQDTLRLKAITYNLRFGELASLEELAARIASEKPDMVALQEVDCHTRREGIPHQHGKDFATELGFRTGMFPLYGKTIAFAGGWYGIGLLTARPYLGVRKLMLPQASAQEESRALLLVTVEVGQDTVVFASTHLGLSEESRRMQTECIRRRFQCGARCRRDRCDDVRLRSVVRDAADLSGRRSRRQDRLPVRLSGRSVDARIDADHAFRPVRSPGDRFGRRAGTLSGSPENSGRIAFWFGVCREIPDRLSIKDSNGKMK